MDSNEVSRAARPTASRLRTILGVGACTVVPAWLLVAGLRISPGASVSILSVAFTVGLSVSLVRGATVTARWVAMGPGRRSDRVIWSVFLVAMLTLTPLAAFRPGDAFGVALLVPYFAMQTIYWRFARFVGEREEMEGSGADTRLGIEDALVALALFCIVVATARMCIDWRSFHVRREEATVLLLSCCVLPAAGLIPFFCDLGMRAAIRSRSSRDRRIGIAIVTIPTAIAFGSLLVAVAIGRNEYVVSSLGFVVAYFLYAALQETVLAASGIVATVDSAPSEGGEGPTPEATSEERRSSRVT